MLKKILFPFCIILFLTILITPLPVGADSSYRPQNSTSAELVESVNALRISQGLSPYQQNSILMRLAQEHAEYMASIGMSTIHTDARGFKPFQRALEAGYAVAGDIYTNVGFFSENVTGGPSKTAQEAVDEWMGDAPHRGTMLSTNLQDVGAGVAVVGNTYYYCLDAGLSTGGTPRAFTPPASYNTPVAPLIPNTPNADGSIVYIVQPSDTALGIALAYGISLDELYALNGLTKDSIIYPDQQLVIRPGYTPTPTLPTATPTERYTITPWPTSSQIATITVVSATPTRPAIIPATTAQGSALVIIISALLLAGLLLLISRKRK
jgi:uncharacterized protein YkwD